MKFLTTCWIIAVFLAGPSLAHAGGCRTVAVVHRNNVVVVKDVVAAVVTPVVAQFVPVAFAVPTYNAIYGGGYQYPGYAPPAPAYAPPQPAAVAPCAKHEDAFKQIASLLTNLDDRLSRLEGGGASPLSKPPLRINPMEKVEDGQGAAPQALAPGNLLGVMAKNCASCHADAQKKGGLTLMSGGSLANLTEQQLGSIIDRLTTDDPKRIMPPAGATAMPVGDRLKMISLLVNAPPTK